MFLAIKRRVIVVVLTADDRSKAPATAPPPFISVKAASDAVNLQLRRSITFAHWLSRHIGIGLQQKIGESVSVENDVLGLTTFSGCKRFER